MMQMISQDKEQTASEAMNNWSEHRCKGRLSEASYPVVVDLLQCFIADGPLKNHPLEGVAFVTGHQLHTDHFSFSHSHVTKNLPKTQGATF